MSYTRQNFRDGDVLNAAHLIAMEDAIIENESAAQTAENAYDLAMQKVEVFLCDVGSTASWEIQSALDEGKLVYCEYSGHHIPLVKAESETKHIFYGVTNDTVMTITCENDSWGYSGAAFTPRHHASADTSYGMANRDQYGHVKLSASVTDTSSSNGGVAATPSAVKQAYDKAVEALNKANNAATVADILAALPTWTGGSY